MLCEHGNIAPCVECDIEPLKAENTALKEENKRLMARVAKLVEALESLVKGYVNLLEAGRDRIASLGGDCDPVPVMEQNDPWLRDARATLAAYRKGNKEGPSHDNQ